MKAIILAGGFGTRLQSVVSDVPKPMALVSGRPFLEVLISNLILQGVSDITLSVGYKHEVIKNYFGSSFNETNINYVVEDAPLGTGGALVKSLSGCQPDEGVFVLNGDTFLDVDLSNMKMLYDEKCADVGMALKSMGDAYRYGRVLLNSDNVITKFEEKGSHEAGLINAGVYILKPNFFDKFDLPDRFSLENDCFVQYLNDIDFLPFVVDGYFIDIGVPEDYERAQTELVSFMQ